MMNYLDLTSTYKHLKVVDFSLLIHTPTFPQRSNLGVVGFIYAEADGARLYELNCALTSAQ